MDRHDEGSEDLIIKIERIVFTALRAVEMMRFYLTEKCCNLVAVNKEVREKFLQKCVRLIEIKRIAKIVINIRKK